jgi:glycosyltransferase involved in cell wall biosynthesis
LGEVIGEGKTGFLVPPESPDAIADAVVGFFEQGRDEEFARNIEAEKMNYSWERFIERVEEAILRARSGSGV